MSGVHPTGEGAGPFETIDPKLNVFALANGMDLAKGEEHRRLEWFSDGRERGIRIETDGPTRYRVAALAWKSGKADDLNEEEVGTGVAVAGLSGVLQDAIDVANRL